MLTRVLSWSKIYRPEEDGLCTNAFFVFLPVLSLVLLLISNLTNGLRLHQFLVTKSVEANKSVKTDANGAH